MELDVITCTAPKFEIVRACAPLKGAPKLHRTRPVAFTTTSWPFGLNKRATPLPDVRELHIVRPDESVATTLPDTVTQSFDAPDEENRHAPVVSR